MEDLDNRTVAEYRTELITKGPAKDMMKLYNNVFKLVQLLHLPINEIDKMELWEFNSIVDKIDNK